MLVYNLPRTEAISIGIAGSAYFVGGLGMTALTGNDIIVAWTAARSQSQIHGSPTWNPF